VRDELLAVMSAGAYGFSMSSNYNSRPRIPEILVRDDRFTVIRKRESYEDLIREKRSRIFCRDNVSLSADGCGVS